MSNRKKIAIVIPVYGNADSLSELYRQLDEVLKGQNVDPIFLFVNDRSPDRSQEILEQLAEKDPRVKILLLSKNHGSFVAIVAGLNHIQGIDAAVIMSADLQDPPSAVPELLAQWERGVPVVLGVRQQRKDNFLTKFFAGIFHNLFRKFVMKDMPKGGFDFCLIDKKVIDVLISSSEKNTSLTGLIIWAGFERAFVPYVRAERPYGKSMWTFRKKIRFAINSVIAFSSWPLKLFGVFGITLALLCLIGAIAIFINYFFGNVRVPGWTSLVFMILTLASFQFIGLAILGEYFWSNMEQNRKRPLFIVDRMIGFCNQEEELRIESYASKDDTVPFFSLQAVSKPIRNSLNETCARVLHSRQIILGPEVERFERELAVFLGVRNVVGVANGTDAITLALMAAGIQPGDDVITTSISAPATAVAILRAGARPVFVDVKQDDLTLSPECLEKAIKPGVKAIVPVHLYGNPCAMREIIRIAEKHHVIVIEDCAQSLGTVINETHCGAFGSISAFSFYPTKNLGGYGDGGAVATNNDDFAAKLKRMRFYGLDKSGECIGIGFNSRLDELQAALLSDRMKHLEVQNEERKDIAKEYDQALTFLDPIPSRSGRVPHLYVVRPKDRIRFREYLLQHGIQTEIHYPKALSKHDFLKEHCIDTGTVVAQEACQQVVSLPCFPGLKSEQIGKVIKVCKSWKESQK
jgi:dTDP-4-amino-4,6-dideoxygalactose transaminase/glycosyltransferase involved in cell wall biosynthesis